MDGTDVKLVNLLQEDCKRSVKELGQNVGLTAPAVSERINRLKDAGVIEGFHAQVNDARMGSGISAFVLVNVPPEQYEEFCAFCEGESAVSEHHHIIGVNNALLRVRVRDAGMLEEFLTRLRRFGISNTSVLLSTYFTRKAYPEKTP